VEAISQAAASTDDKAKAAIAVLRYFAKPDDVAPDTLEYRDHLDDIHVIERAYADLER